MIAAIQRTLVGRTLAALAALAILVGGWHAATAHGGAHAGAHPVMELDEHAHRHGHMHEHHHGSADGTRDASHTVHDQIDHDHPQSLATARRTSAAPAGGTRLAVAHQGSPPQRNDAPFRPPRS